MLTTAISPDWHGYLEKLSLRRESRGAESAGLAGSAEKELPVGCEPANFPPVGASSLEPSPPRASRFPWASLALLPLAAGACRGEASAPPPVTPPPGLAGAPGCFYDAWVVARPCSTLKLSEAWSAEPVHPDLSGYCRLRSDPVDLEPEAGLNAQPDCLAVVPMGAPGEGGDREQSLLAAGLPAKSLEGASPVRAVVVDDVEDRAALGHGTRVGAIVEELVGSSSVTYVRALRPEGDAAARGSLSELASALLEAVPRDSEPTVVVASLGWSAEAAESLDPLLRPGPSTGVVLEAMRRIACRGAVMAAASGVESGWPTRRGSARVYPSAWSTLSGPSAERCDALSEPQSSFRAPLAYSVGAARFDAEGTPRALSIQPRVASPTLYALGRIPPGDGRPSLVGTSAATAVVGAALVLYRATHAGAVPSVDVLLERAMPMSDVPRVEVVLAFADTPGAYLVRPCALAGLECGPTALPEPELSEAAVSVAAESGYPCPRQPKTIVFSSNADARKAACEVDPRSDRLLRPSSVGRGSRPSCRTCVGRAPAGAKVVELDLALEPDALEPAYLVFSTDPQHAIHPLRGLEVRDGRLSARIELPGPIPRTLEARVFFADPLGGWVAEDVALVR